MVFFCASLSSLWRQYLQGLTLPARGVAKDVRTTSVLRIVDSAKRMRRTCYGFVVMVLMLVSVSSLAAEIPGLAQREITHLLDYVADSGCSFERNGSWYDAAEARRHLEMKYNYLNRLGLVTKAEDFIELAATKSSVSRKPYHIRCNGRLVMASGVWLSSELARYRSDSRQRTPSSLH